MVYVVCCLILCLFCGCGRRDGIQTFREAQNVFDAAQNAPLGERAEKFRQAAALYEDLVRQGIKSGAVYYNLGNAYAGAGEPAKALAAYHLARRYRPRDPQITANIQTALGGSAPADLETPLAERLLFWQNSVGVQAKVHCSLLFAVLTFIGAAFRLFFPKRQLKYLTLVSLTVCVLAALSVGYDWYRFEKTQYAVVAVEQAFVRKGNSENYESAFAAAVPFGSTAVVVYERNHWLFLRFGAEHSGWLPKGQVVLF